MAKAGRGWAGRLALLAAAVCWALAASAPGRAAEVSYAAFEGRAFDSFNRSMFDVEREITAWWDRNISVSGTVADVPWWLGVGINNFVTNLINEPLTLVSSLVAFDFLNALNSSQRLFINTVFGLGGVVDVASMAGLPEKHLDLGLSLCAHGLPGGPYVFIPFIGPRTLRDAVMDYVVAYTLYVYVASLLTGPSPPILLFVAAKNALWIAEVATIKQMDMEAAAAPTETEAFEDVRENYLRGRNYRCQMLRHEIY